ncbi:MAG: DUF6011 domain-containing protein [Desulfobulbaceae bacterium]|nr:DUF6011 domain-containing protein [Desulfobulbaceae bacterium]
MTTFTLETNGLVTLTSPKTGHHRTFLIRTEKWKGNGKWAPRKVRVVSLFVGDKNTNNNHFLRFGEVREQGGEYRIHLFKEVYTKGVPKKFWGKKPERKTFAAFAKLLEEPAKAEGAGVKFLASVKCCRCNLTLTDPESIENGFGDECAKYIRRGEGRTERPVMVA